jgi:hypothetical protein
MQLSPDGEVFNGLNGLNDLNESNGAIRPRKVDNSCRVLLNP